MFALIVDMPHVLQKNQVYFRYLIEINSINTTGLHTAPVK